MVELLHVSLWVSDLERALAFYGNGLGYEVARSYVRRGDEDNVYLADDAGRELQLKHAPGRDVTGSGDESTAPGDDSTASRNGFDHFAVAVEDADAMVERLEGLGGELQRGPREASNGDFRYAFVTDPDGHRVEVIGELG